MQVIRLEPSEPLGPLRGAVAWSAANIERWMYAENVKGKPSRYAGHGPDFADGWDRVLAYYDSLHTASRAIFAICLMGNAPSDRE